MAIFATGVEEPEGPVVAGEALFIVEMSSRRSCVTRLGSNGSRIVVSSTGGRPNGLALDGDGNLWVAEAGQGVLLCIDQEGRTIRRITNAGGGRFLWPNDLAFGADGFLYMTDSGIMPDDFIDGLSIRENFMTLPYEGCVYRIDAGEGRVADVVDRGFRFTNGIAFDGNGALFVNESIGGNIYRYELRGGKAPVRHVFGNVLQEDARPVFKGPDGMKFGSDGRLYCTVYNQGNISVLDENGVISERIRTQGDKPTNVAFSRDQSKLFVTEVSLGQVELMDVKCNGLELHYPKIA